MFDQRTNFYNVSAEGVFASKLHNNNNIGTVYMNKSLLCRPDKQCPHVIEQKYNMYLLSSSTARMLGERIDEFSMNLGWIDFNQCYR